MTRARAALFVSLCHLSLIGGFALSSSLSPRAQPSEEKTPGVGYSAVKLYTIYTALHADYSFFAPEVGSSHELQIEFTDKTDASYEIQLSPSNREVNVRFSCMLLIFTRDRVFQELIARSIAATAYKQCPSATSITVSVYRYNLPTIAEYRSGQKPDRTLYFKSVHRTPNAEAAAL